jgi:hypothetical protein
MSIDNRSAVANPNTAGSTLLLRVDTLLTDAAPEISQILSTAAGKKLVIDVLANKGCEITITRLPDPNDDTVEGVSSTPIIIPAGGGADAVVYSSPGAKAKLSAEKTEAGDMAEFLLTARLEG